MSQTSALDLENDDGARRLLYLCTLILIFVPWFQVLSGLWPFQMSNIEYRIRATNSVSGVLMLPFIGMALAVVIARVSANKGVAKVIGVFAVLTVIGVVLATGLFAMDALQLKKVVPDRAMSNFNKVLFTTGGSLFISLVSFTWLAIVSFRGPQGVMRPTPPKTKMKNAAGDESVGLLIGQDYTK